MEDAGIKAGDKDAIIVSANTFDETERRYDTLTDNASKYTAVFCCSDTSAVLLINALEKKGIHVPDDVSVIGFDDNADAQLSRPALTTIRQDINLKGKKAVESLLSMINGTVFTSRNIVLGTKLIERGSVRDI